MRAFSSSRRQVVADVPLKPSGIVWVAGELVLGVAGDASITRVVLTPNDVAVLLSALAKHEGHNEPIR